MLRHTEVLPTGRDEAETTNEKEPGTFHGECLIFWDDATRLGSSGSQAQPHQRVKSAEAAVPKRPVQGIWTEPAGLKHFRVYQWDFVFVTFSC